MKDKIKNLASGILATLLTLGASGYALAAESIAPDEFSLEDIVVTSTATPNSSTRANASITVITRKEIEDNHYKTMSEILQNVPGINSVYFADGAGFEISGESSLTMRGTSNCLVAVDGVVQKTGNSYKQHLLTMNTDDIERIEVMRGAAGTLYGANAVGGVVNIIMRRDYAEPTTKLTAAAGNFGYQNYHVNTNGNDEKGFWSISYDKAKKGDYDDGNGAKTTRSVDSDFASIRLGAHLNDETDFILNYQKLDYESSASYHLKRGDYNWKADYDMQTLSATLDYKSKDGKEADNFTVLYGRWKSDRNRSSVLGGPAVDWEDVDRDNIDIVNRYYRQLSDRNRIAAGLEYQKYSVATTSAPDREISERAFYIQDEWDITKKLKLTAGARYVKSNSYDSEWFTSFNLAYAFSDKLSVYATSNEFYITPSTTAIFGSSAFLANPNIKPQSGRNNEVGMLWAVDDKTRFDIALYDRRVEDAIVIESTSKGNRYTNIGGITHVKGGEVSFRKDFGKYYTFKATYSRLVVDDESEIPRLPKTQYTLGLAYDRDFYNINLNAVNRSDFAPNNYFPDGYDDYLPEKNYWVWNLAANYKVNKNINVFAKLNNIFDKAYMSATQYSSSGALVGEPIYPYYAQGRNFVIGVEYAF